MEVIDEAVLPFSVEILMQSGISAAKKLENGGSDDIGALLWASNLAEGEGEKGGKEDEKT